MQDKGVVIVGVANLYKEPSKAVEMVTQAIVGTEVAIWETREGWYYVRLPDLYQGWIFTLRPRPLAPDWNCRPKKTPGCGSCSPTAPCAGSRRAT